MVGLEPTPRPRYKREQTVPAMMRILAKHKRLLALHDYLRRIGILNHDDLCVDGQCLKVSVELLLKISAGQVIFRSIWLSVCQQRRVEHDESRVRRLARPTESKQPEGKSRMRDGAKALAKSTTRLSGNDKIPSLGIEVHISSLGKVPTCQYSLDNLGKTVGHGGGEICACKRPGLLVLGALLKIAATALHVLHGGVECQRFAHLGPLVGKVGIGLAKGRELGCDQFFNRLRD